MSSCFPICALRPVGDGARIAADEHEQKDLTMPFELRIALRYLTAKRKQAFISVISTISVLGVVVGVMALMVALGLMTGLQREIRTKILGTTAHVSIFRSGNEPFEDYRDVVAKVRRVPRVLGAAPAVYGKGLMKT